jgi:hypothetical protein
LKAEWIRTINTSSAADLPVARKAYEANLFACLQDQAKHANVRSHSSAHISRAHACGARRQQVRATVEKVLENAEEHGVVNNPNDEAHMEHAIAEVCRLLRPAMPAPSDCSRRKMHGYRRFDVGARWQEVEAAVKASNLTSEHVTKVCSYRCPGST